MNANKPGIRRFQWLLVFFFAVQLASAGGTKPFAFDAFSQIEAESYSGMSGLQSESCFDTGAGSNIGSTDNGDYMFYTAVNFGTGTVKSLNFRIASAATFTGYADIRIDGPTGTIIGTVAFGNTGGWQSWVTRKVPVTTVSGTKNVYVTFSGSSPSIGNVNWLQFSTDDLSVNAFTKIEAESYNTMSGLQTEACSDTGGGSDVAWTDAGDYMVYNNINFNSASVKSLQFRIASQATFTGNAEIRLDSPTGTLIATVPFGSTGGWQTWVTRKVSVSAVTGIKNIYVVFTGGTGIGNINWLQFSTEDLSPSIFNKIEAENNNGMTGLQTEACGDIGGGLNVGSCDANDYMVFNNINFGTGTAKSVSVRIASAAAFAGYADLRIDSPTGTLIGSVPFGTTGGWQNWITKKVAVSAVSGTKNLYVVLRGGNGVGNINWLQFSTDDITIPEVPATLAAATSNSQVVLSWQIALQAISYNIKRATTSGGPYTTIQSNWANNTYTDAAVSNGVTYYYIVTAVNPKGESASSNQVSVTPQVDIRVSCIGDSITAGAGVDPSTQSYPVQLDNQLSSSYVVTNFGFSGATMLKNADTPYWNQGVYTSALNSNPGVVVIMLGTNDSKSWNWNSYGSQYIADYKSMIDAFNNLTSKPKIYICLPAKAFSEAYAISEPNLANFIRPYVIQVANEKGVSVIDVYDATKDASANFPDGVHPNVTGAGQIATKVRQIITTASPNFTVNGAVLTAPAGYAYQWFKDGAPLAGATAQTYQVAAAGKYKVLIKVNSANNDRIISNEQTVSGNFPPALPSNLVATAANTQIALTWSAVTGATSYTVKRSTSTTGIFTTLQSGLTGTAYTNTGLANGITYYYQVTAANSNGTSPAATAAATAYGNTAAITSGNTYVITSKSAQKVLNIVGASTANGARVQLDNSGAGTNQKWKFESTGDGFYNLTNINSSKTMDVVDASTANNGQIQQWDYFGSPNQKWKIEDAGNGYVRIYAAISGKLLDAGANGSAGQLIFQNDGDGSDRQLWQLTTTTAFRMMASAGPEKDSVGGITVYPSLANTEIFIENALEGTIQSIALYAMDGRKVSEITDLGDKKTRMAVELLPDGIYNVLIIPASGEAITKKIVIRH